MSVSETSHSASFDVSPLGGLASGTRVDPAHVMAKDDPPAAEPPVTNRAAEPDAVARVRTQASQLAAYLQRQATAVDHRESELNSRLASLENQIRGARLWISEQHLDIEQRQAEINRREQELDERKARATNAAGPAQNARQRVDRRRQPGSPRSGDPPPPGRARRIGGAAGRSIGRLARSRRSAASATVARVARKELERGEQMLAADQAEVQRQRNQLALARSRFAEETEAQRQRAAQQQERLTAEHDKARLELKRQADELAARQTVLEQMRADVSRSQQEVLEIRLATEELWARLCGTMAPAALSRSLAKIRVQLAEQQKLVRSELAQQKFEIQELSARLTEQHHKLAERRTAIERHSDQRQQELAAQAARLVEQERQLNEQIAELNRERESWQDERFRLNQEIRRLLRERSRPLHAA